MSSRRASLNKTITRSLCAGSLMIAGIAHAASDVAPITDARSVQGAVTFQFLPAGGLDEAAITQLLQTQAALLGSRPVSLDQVNAWSDRLTAALRSGGFPIGQVLMTEQAWRATQQGAAPVFTVLPGRIREIRIENKSRVRDSRVKAFVEHALCGGDTSSTVCVLKTSRLERATQLLQDVPGIAIDKAPTFSPGAGTGDVDVMFSVAQRGKPVSVDLIADNKGIESTGSYRFGLTGTANNVFGLGETYAFTLTDTNKNMWTGSFVGTVPVLDDGLRLTGGISRQQYTINAGTPVEGIATVGQAGLLFPITRGLDQNIWAGASLLHSHTSTTFKDFTFATHSTLDSIRLSLQADNGDRAQQLRTNIYTGQAALTLGHQSNDNGNVDNVTHVGGNYAKLSGSGLATYALTRSGNTFLSGRINAQLASRNLDPSEKLTFGGPDAVRAYRADEGSYDDGLVANAGIYQRFPIAAGHQLQLGAFVDVAYGAINHHPWADWQNSYPGVSNVTNTRTLAGYGLSLDWLTPIGATASISVAKPFGFSSASWIDPGKKPLQYWLSVTWSH